MHPASAWPTSAMRAPSHGLDAARARAASGRGRRALPVRRSSTTTLASSSAVASATRSPFGAVTRHQAIRERRRRGRRLRRARGSRGDACRSTRWASWRVHTMGACPARPKPAGLDAPRDRARAGAGRPSGPTRWPGSRCAAGRGLGPATARPVRHECDLRAPCRAPGPAADASRNARDAGRDAGRVRTLGSGAWLGDRSAGGSSRAASGARGGRRLLLGVARGRRGAGRSRCLRPRAPCFSRDGADLPHRAAAVESVRAAGGSLDQRRGDRRDRRRAGGRAPHAGARRSRDRRSCGATSRSSTAMRTPATSCTAPACSCGPTST